MQTESEKMSLVGTILCKIEYIESRLWLKIRERSNSFIVCDREEQGRDIDSANLPPEWLRPRIPLFFLGQYDSNAKRPILLVCARRPARLSDFVDFYGDIPVAPEPNLIFQRLVTS